MIHLLFIAASLLLVSGLSYLVHRWPAGGMRATFSQHAAASPAATKFYILLFVVSLPLLVVWHAVWLAPSSSAPYATTVLIAFAAVFQIAAACVPERKPHILAHRALTSASVAAILLHTTTLWASTGRSIVALCLALMIGVVAYAVVMRDKAKYPMILQIVLYAAFFVALGSFI